MTEELLVTSSDVNLKPETLCKLMSVCVFVFCVFTGEVQRRDVLATPPRRLHEGAEQRADGVQRVAHPTL